MSNNEADRLAEPEIQLALFLSQFELDEQERILRYALDHVVPRLKGRAALAKQQAPEATAEPVAVSVGVVEALERLTRWAQAAHGDKTTYSGDHPIAWAMQALAAQDTQKAEAWKSAHDDARDAILNGRGPLEAVLDGDQTNAVLGAFDDAFSPLYATPQKAEATQAEPMSDETIERMVLNRPDMAQAIHFDIIPMGAFVDLGRAILAEAGIKDKT